MVCRFEPRVRPLYDAVVPSFCSSSKESDFAKNLELQLRDWQQSVLKSLTGADYP